jgi:tetratricopeptide (TPR) repeat protein
MDLEQAVTNAQGLAARGEIEESARVIVDVLRFHPFAAAERFLLGAAKIATSDHSGGQKEMERSLMLAPHIALHWRQFGNFQLRLGRRERAGQQWWRALRCAPDDTDLLLEMLNIIHEANDLPDATRYKFHSRFMAFAASNWRVLRILSAKADRRQQYSLSERCLRQAIVATPSISETYLYMYFMSKYRYSAGEQCSFLRRGICALNTEQNLTLYLRFLGFYVTARRLLGDTGPLIGDLQKTMSIPTLTNLQRLDLLRHLASCQIEAGDLNSGLENLKTIDSARPRQPTTYLLDTWAGYYYAANDRVNYDRLYNLDFVKRYDLKEIAPKLDIQKFNSALHDRVTKHPSLKLLFRGDRGGYSQTNDRGPGSLLEDQAPELVRLRLYFERILARYLAELPHDDSHPFLKLRGEPLRLSIFWGLAIKNCQSSPTHRHGDDTFATAIYYPNEDVDRGDGSDPQAGWLETFRHELNIDMASTDIRTFEPLPGHFIILPSYFYHRALPLMSAKTRVSIVADFNFVRE